MNATVLDKLSIPLRPEHATAIMNVAPTDVSELTNRIMEPYPARQFVKLMFEWFSCTSRSA
jgi:hypothetical protein